MEDKDLMLQLLLQGKLSLLLQLILATAFYKCTPGDLGRVTWEAMELYGQHYCCTKPRLYDNGEGYSLCWQVARLGHYSPINSKFYEIIPGGEEDLLPYRIQEARPSFPYIRYRINKCLGGNLLDHHGDELQKKLLTGSHWPE